jgi:hypothetical protein
MSFCSSASGRACLNEWDGPLAVNDILTFLLALKQASATAGCPVILIVVVRETVPVPANYLLTCIQGTLPAILDCCEQLVLVVEGASVERAPFRAAFQVARQLPARRAPTLVFELLNSAFVHAQRFAPHDVLELQRHVLHQSFPPNGQCA